MPFGNLRLSGKWFEPHQRPDFFCVELKYIQLRRDLESLKNATEFGHVPTSENQSVFTVWAKGEI